MLASAAGTDLHLLLRGNHELHDLRGSSKWPVRCVRQFEFHGVWTRFQSDEDHRSAARVDDGPRLLVDLVVQVSHARRDCQGRTSEHRQDAQVFRSILDEYTPQRQLLGNARINDELRRHLVRDRD